MTRRDDFLQIDLQAINLTRAFGLFMLNTLLFYATTKTSRNLLPIGRFGIRNFTYITILSILVGVLGAVGVFLTGYQFTNQGAITEYKTFKFTLHKFYRHVLMG